MAEAAETGVAMHYLDLFSDYNIPKYWKEGEDGWHCRLSINNEKGNMVNFKSIRKIVDSCTAFVGMGDDNNLVTAVDEPSGELIDVAFNSSRLRKEEVADHGNVVRHLGRDGRLRPSRAAVSQSRLMAR